MKYKAGDTVICVSGGRQGAGWTLGRVFVIDHIDRGILWLDNNSNGIYPESVKYTTWKEIFERKNE